MSFTLLSVAIIFILATAIVSGAVRGSHKGFFKEFLSFITLIASLMISLAISPVISQFIAVSAVDIVKMLPLYGTVIPQSVYVDLLITIIASVIISSVIFIAVMLLLRLVFSILLKIIFKKADKSESVFPEENAPAYERRPRVWGAAVGALSGLLSTIIIFAPITGSLQMVNHVIDMIDNADRNFFALDVAREQVNNFKKYANDGVAMTLYNMGGELIYSSAASANVNGETVYAVHEIETFEQLVDDFVTLFPVIVAPENITPEQADSIDELCNHMDETKVLDIVMAEFLPQAANAWLRGEVYMLIPKPAMNEFIAPAFDGVLEVCANSTMYNIKDNTTSLLRIYSIILSSGIMKAGDDFNQIIDCIQSSNLIEKLDAEIDKNPNMIIIKTYTAEIAMRAIADEIYGDSIGDILEEDYTVLTERLAEAIETINNKGYGTKEEKVSAMMSYAQEYLGDYGVSLPASVAQPVAEIMLDRINTNGGVSADDIQNFLKSYLSN